MAKKYLSSEEASAELDISIDELNRLRESGELRGFADRGTFKFKQEDIEEYARSRQADSDPEVPLHIGESDDSVLSPDEDALSEQPTVIRREDTDAPLMVDDSGSDSDVRLVLPDALTEDEAPSLGDSDSDVRLVGDDSAAPLLDSGSDSDVKLIADADETGSHIQLAEDARTDSSLLQQSEDETGLGLGEEDDAISLEDDGGESVLLEDDSGIALDAGSDVGLAADSGISLESPADSGISLESPADSEIALEADEDSGISLAADDDLELAADSGISLDDSTDQTIPVPRPDASAHDETEFEAPLLEDDESDFELGTVEEGSDADTSVILFDDEDEDEAAAVATDDFEIEDEDEFTADFGDDFEEAGVALDDELDVFDADEEDFDAFQTGQSHTEFAAAPIGMAAARPGVEANWGAGTFIGLLSSSLVLLLCLAVMFDLVRSMWGWRETSPITQPVIDAIAGLMS
jgi:hypothetical protein